jgi:glycosyltransferase involved in cell wall biosynthesis
MSFQSRKMLLMGQTPPPWHGQAVATKMLFEHSWKGWDVSTLRMAYSGEMHEVGRFSLGKILHLWKLIREARRRLGKERKVILFYPPASANWVPFLRDVIFLTAVRPRARGTVFIFHASGLASWTHSNPLRRWLASKAYGKPELSLEVAVELEAPQKIFHAQRWQWCPCAADVPAMTRQARPPGEALSLLFVGSLQEGKGVLEILETARILRQQGKIAAFRFRIIGRWFSQEFKDRALALLERYDLQEWVSFPGEVTGDEKWRAYREADLFFFPSHYQSEASPIVLMEALGAGLPVLSTEWRGIPALVGNCSAAKLLPVRSPQRYAEALCEWEARREHLHELAQAARAHYEANFRPHHFVGRIESALSQAWSPENNRDSSNETSPNKPDRQHLATPVRMLQVFNQYSEQGGEQLWVDQLTSLADERMKVHELRFLSRTWKMPGAPSPLHQAWRIWDNPESRRRLRRTVEELNPDLLLFHNLIPVGSFGLYDEARRLGLPVIQYIHNFRPFSPSGTLWTHGQICDDALHGNSIPEVMAGAWERSRLKTAVLAMQLRRLRNSGWLDSVDRWIAVSDFMRRKFIEAGLPPEKVVTLRHCWSPAHDGTPAQDGGYYLFLGRLVEEKGVRTLLDAWNRLESEMGKSCPRLVIAGTGPEESRLINACARNPHIEAAGFVSGEAKQRLLAGCRAVLAPSIWWEPLGLIVYEAYDFCKPVIAARSGGLVETVQEGEGGFLHDPGDSRSLADAILRLEQCGAEGRQSMGITGRKWLIDHANPERWREHFRTIAQQVIRG